VGIEGGIFFDPGVGKLATHVPFIYCRELPSPLPPLCAEYVTDFTSISSGFLMDMDSPLLLNENELFKSAPEKDGHSFLKVAGSEAIIAKEPGEIIDGPSKRDSL
jgi:hypothetical protein